MNLLNYNDTTSQFFKFKSVKVFKRNFGSKSYGHILNVLNKMEICTALTPIKSIPHGLSYTPKLHTSEYLYIRNFIYKLNDAFIKLGPLTSNTCLYFLKELSYTRSNQYLFAFLFPDLQVNMKFIKEANFNLEFDTKYQFINSTEFMSVIAFNKLYNYLQAFGRPNITLLPAQDSFDICKYTNIIQIQHTGQVNPDALVAIYTKTENNLLFLRYYASMLGNFKAFKANL